MDKKSLFLSSFFGTFKKKSWKVPSKYFRTIFWKLTLSYRIVVAHQISVALGTFWEINKRSPSNKRSLGKIQQPIIKVAPLIDKITLSQFIVMDSDLR